MTQTHQTLSQELAPDASATIQKRGRAYFRDGRVASLKIRNKAVHAVVNGSQPYTVQILAAQEADGEVALEGSCTCPYFDGGDICKHIWAVILKIEQSDQAHQALMLDIADSVILDPADHDALDDDDDNALSEVVYDEYQADEPPDPPIIETQPPDGRSADLAAPTPQNRRNGSQSDQRAAPDWAPILQSAAHMMRVHSSRALSALPRDNRILYFINLDQQGNIVISVRVQRRTRDGSWSKPTSRNIPPIEIARLPDPIDRQCLLLLYGLDDVHSTGWRYTTFNRQMQFTVPVDAQRTVIEQLARSNRCCVALDETTPPDDTAFLRWDDDGPWTFRLSIERDGAADNSYMLAGHFERDDRRLDLMTPMLLTAGNLILIDDTFAPLDDNGAFELIAHFRQHGALRVPADQIDDLLEHLLNLPSVPDVSLPEDVHIEHKSPEPTPRLRIFRPTNQGDETSWRSGADLRVELAFDYDGVIFPWSSPQPAAYQRDRRCCIVRHTEAEYAARQTAIQCGFRMPNTVNSDPDVDLTVSQRNLQPAIAPLIEAGWHVEAEGAVYRTGGALNLEINASGVDWFELAGEARFDDQTIELPALLRALKTGETFVTLDDGSAGLLPEQWAERYARLGELGGADEDGRIRFRSTQIGLIDALLDQMPEVNFDEQVARARKKLAKFTKIRPRKAPRGFKGELRPYQRDGLGWLAFLRELGFGGCLADDMGLGKTVQVLAMLEQRRQQRRRDNGRTPPSLIVVPRSLIHNWHAETQRFTPNMRCLDHTGQGRYTTSADALTHDAIAHFDEYDLIFTTYGTLRRDINAIKDVRFDYVVLDESQAIKNPATASAKAARLLQADHRLALSGTPIENHLGELWSLFEFLNPGMLGPDSKTIARLGAANKNGNTDDDPSGDPGHEMLARAVRPFVLRRTKQQVAADLPEKTEQTLYCELQPKQRKLYDELRRHYRSSLMAKIDTVGLKRSKIMVLEALLRLRQAACHPGLIDEKHRTSPSAKMDALMPQLEEVIGEGHKALVFSQFTTFLSIVRQRLDAEGVAYAYLDGRTRKRAERVREFQENPDCKLFLISLKAGGLGLNLTEAEYVFLLDPWWNPAVEAQAIDRAHRIGQSRQVFAYRLIARDTVEEKVLELQQSKRALADAIIRADANLIRSLTVDDLRTLLS